MPSEPTTTFDLGPLTLARGDGRRIEVEVSVPELTFAGERYRVSGDRVDARLEISRTAGGYALRLAFEASVVGPCMRCLEEIGLPVAVESREVDEGPEAGEGLTSPYVSGDVVDLGAWVRDELALEVPDRFLCRPDGEDRCPVCGIEVERPAPGGEAPPDPRWAKLREIDLG